MRGDVVMLLQELLDKIHETVYFADLKKIKVRSKGLFGNTPLHVVITWEDVEAVRLLLSNGADVNAKGEYDFTPLHRALLFNVSEIVSLLLKNGADPSIRNADGENCYDLANRIGNIELLKGI